MTVVLDDPVALDEAADRLRGQAGAYDDVGTLLRGLRTDGWTGSAAESFRSLFGAEPRRWFDAADTLLAAAGALDAHADVSRWAHDRLHEARLLDELAARAPSPDAAVRMAEQAHALAADALSAFADSSWRTSVRLDAAAAAAPTARRWADEPWWDVAWRAAADGGVDSLNALASVGAAIGHHPGAAAGLVGGIFLADLGAGVGAGSVALDLTGVGALVGLPAGALAAGLITTGTAAAASSAADLVMHAATDDARTPVDKLPEGERVKTLTKTGKVRQGVADPAPPRGAQPGWIKFEADSRKGWVWQAPGSFSAGDNADQLRIMDPTSQYPNGYVRFTNSGGQALDIFGKPSSQTATHLEMTADGEYLLPEGWAH